MQAAVNTEDQQQRSRQIGKWLSQMDTQQRGPTLGRRRSFTAQRNRRRLLLVFTGGATLIILSLLQEFFF